MIAETFTWLFNLDHWVGSNASAGNILQRLIEHLLLSNLTMLIAAVIAIPAGILIGHTSIGSGAITAFSGAARAIPTLGLLTLFGLLLGLGLIAPLLALIILAIPSMLVATYSGIRAINPVIEQSAKAIGLNPWQIVFKVQVPLALPTIVGGIRAAMLQVIATATLAAFTADYGLGRFLFTGLKTRDYPQMLASAILVVLLALIVDLLLAMVQKFVQEKISRPSSTKTANQVSNLPANRVSNLGE